MLNVIKEKIEELFYSAFGMLGCALLLLLPLGMFNWIYMAVKYDSFFMFVVGFIPFPPLWLFTGAVGAYSYIYEPPDWLLKLFLG